MWLHKSHHRIHVASLKHSLGNPLQLATQQTVAQLWGHPTALEQAEKKALGCCLLGALLKVSYLGRELFTIKTQFNITAVHRLNTLFEKLISHGICTLVSWSLTVLRNCVKGPEAPFHHSEKATAPKNEAWSSCKYIWRNKAIFANVERKGRNCRFCFVLILFLQHYEKAITLICKAFTFTIAFNKI